jgi:hypothetical protein
VPLVALRLGNREHHDDPAVLGDGPDPLEDAHVALGEHLQRRAASE